MLSDKLRLLGQKWIGSNPWYLAPLSWIYASFVFIRNKLYDYSFLPVTQVPCTVVSIGNVVAGGTGKTPFARMLANAFPNRKVAILSRGYGKVADEALMLGKNFPVFVGKNRAKLAQTIAKDFDLILLDDGFQHRKLHRDFDIVLKSSQKEHYLPWGFLRDSPNRKADVIFEERELELKVLRVLDLQGHELPSIAGMNVFLFCGIANPTRFRKTVEGLGAIVAGLKVFADHAMIDLSKLPKADLYLCTEKDAVKLGKTDLPIFFLEMQMNVVHAVEKWNQLIDDINKNITNGTTK